MNKQINMDEQIDSRSLQIMVQGKRDGATDVSPKCVFFFNTSQSYKIY